MKTDQNEKKKEPWYVTHARKEYERGRDEAERKFETKEMFQQARELHARRLESMQVSCDLVRQAGQAIQAIGEVLKHGFSGR